MTAGTVIRFTHVFVSNKNKYIIANLTQKHKYKTAKNPHIFKDYRVFTVLVMDSNN